MSLHRGVRVYAGVVGTPPGARCTPPRWTSGSQEEAFGFPWELLSHVTPGRFLLPCNF